MAIHGSDGKGPRLLLLGGEAMLTGLASTPDLVRVLVNGGGGELGPTATSMGSSFSRDFHGCRLGFGEDRSASGLMGCGKERRRDGDGATRATRWNAGLAVGSTASTG
ncbi:hypothetical protein M0R45_019563 [Rubus argutus]|uniref:Uncharacterized protein n=1 Tax=Rubus argutus TaxID=59490 RepID=A0AAW1X7D8_RUBAR